MDTTRTCLCGCEQTTGKRSNYKPGHDARHSATIAQLIVENPRRRAALLGTLPSDALRAKAERSADRARAKAAKTEEVAA